MIEEGSIISAYCDIVWRKSAIVQTISVGPLAPTELKLVGIMMNISVVWTYTDRNFRYYTSFETTATVIGGREYWLHF